jgi:hypothetical protein
MLVCFGNGQGDEDTEIRESFDTVLKQFDGLAVSQVSHVDGRLRWIGGLICS